MEGPHVQDFLQVLSSFDDVVMGKHTYDVGLQVGVANPYPHLKTHVVTRSLQESPHENVKLIQERVVERISALKNQQGKPIYLCGGSDLAGQLFQAGLIDELVLKVNPFLMGQGKTLAAQDLGKLDLKLTEHQVYPNGVVFLHYRVLSPS